MTATIPLCFTLFLAQSVAPVAAAPPSAFELHFAPNGNDAWSGRLPRPNEDRTDCPLAPLSGARDALRRPRPALDAKRDMRVVIANGSYPPKQISFIRDSSSGPPWIRPRLRRISSATAASPLGEKHLETGSR